MSAKIFPSIESLVELTEPSDAQISPDGKKIAYVVRQVSWEQNAYTTQIWITTVGENLQSQGKLFAEPAWAPRWSPDGRWLSFISQSPDQHTRQLTITATTDDDIRHPFPLDTGGYAFAWAPDSRSIAYLAQEPIEQEADGEVIVAGERGARSQIWLLDLESHTAHPITRGDFHVTDFSWHPHEHRIAFSACPTAEENDWDRCRIYTLAIDSGEVAPLTQEGCHSPRWSPNGGKIVFQQLGTPSFIGISSLGIIPASGGEIKVLRPFDNDSHLLAWGKTGIYALAIDGITSHLYRINPTTGKVHQRTPDDPPGFTITEGWIGLGCSFSAEFSNTAFVSYDQDHRAEVTLLDCETGKLQRLTRFTRQIVDWHLPTPEIIRWKSYDGLEIEGILIPPVDCQPGKAHPLVVVAHGGPTHTSMLPPLVDGDWWYGAIPQLLHQGAYILMPNYRGSCGYGGNFQASNVPDLGIVEIKDILAGVDTLIQDGKVDPQAVGIVGISHGGYLAAFAATYTNRFKAAVMLSGISDWALNYYLADTRKWMQQYLQSTPWENPEIYQRSSPLTYLPRAQTPLLIQHGENDQRVPIAQAYQLYRGLQDIGTESKLVVYPKMGHGISKPRQFRRCIQETLTWFSDWLWKEGGAHEHH